jgi:hypothetical protein
MKTKENGDARAHVTRLTDAEILREAELIMRAVHLKPRSGNDEILLPSRELTSEDEDRVVLALEKMYRGESE